MTTHSIQTSSYTSNALFEHLKKTTGLHSDYALAKYLDSSAPSISRINTGKQSLPPKMILYIYDNTSLTIEEIRALFAQKLSTK